MTVSANIYVTSNEMTNVVAYVKDGCLVATGYPFPNRRTLHGHAIPPGHVCVHLTFAQCGVSAPCILGDEDENSLLSSGMFHALPLKNLS